MNSLATRFTGSRRRWVRKERQKNWFGAEFDRPVGRHLPKYSSGLCASDRGQRDVWVVVLVLGGLNHGAFGHNARPCVTFCVTVSECCDTQVVSGWIKPLFSRSFLRKLAGMVGFEPTVHCTKNSCLTTWLHPNNEALDTPEPAAVQPLFVGKITLGAHHFSIGLRRCLRHVRRRRFVSVRRRLLASRGRRLRVL